MGLESSNKKRSLEAGRFGYEGLGKETWEGFPSYLGSSNGSSQLQEAEEIRKILEGVTLSSNDEDDIDYETTIEETPKKNNIVNVNGTEIDLDKIFESSSYPVGSNIDKESSTFNENSDSKIEHTIDEITDSIDYSSFEERKTEKEKIISSIRNEINNIKDRITTIRNSINLGQFHAQRVKEQYPIIYQNYMTSLKLLQSYSPNNATYSTTNLEDYLQTELEMYKRVLSSFEEYAQVNFEKKEANKEQPEDRKTLIIEILNLVNNISSFDNGFSLADLAAQFDEESSFYTIEKLQQLKNQYLEMVQSKKTFKEDNKEKIVQEDKNTLIIEILSLMNEHHELDTEPPLPDVIKQLSERNVEELEKIKSAYLPINKNKVNSESNETKIDAMIEAMANGELDTDGQTIIQTENQNSNVRTMGFTAFKMLALVSFVFSVLILIIGTIAMAFMK